MWELRYRNEKTDWIVFYFRNCSKKVAEASANEMKRHWKHVELRKCSDSESRNPYKRREFFARSDRRPERQESYSEYSE